MITEAVLRRISVARLRLPVYADALVAQVFRVWLYVTSSPRRKLILLLVSMMLGALTLWRELYPASLAFLITALSIVLPPLRQRLATRRTLQKLAAKPRSLAGLSPAEETLREMGIASDQAGKVVSLASGREFVVAEFDQNNRVLSHVGPIPLYVDEIIAADSFRKRSRNRMQIVVREGVVAIRKQYSLQQRFANELIALDSLATVDAVPKIIAVDLENRVLHQSYIPGKNLGSLMAARGATVSIQYRVGKSYPGDSETATDPLADERPLLLRALHDTVDRGFIEELERLFVDIHHQGVALRDIKHGNVLIYKGKPYWCDFDLSHRFEKNGLRFLLIRDRERARFNYLFDASLPTLRSLKSQLRPERNAPEDITSKIYYGKGLGSLNLNLTNGSGRWQRVRKHLPQITDRTLIILGGEASVAVGSLRKGAAQALLVTASQKEAAEANLARRAFELIDNRPYPVDVVHERGLNQLQPESIAGAMIIALPALGRAAVDLQQSRLFKKLAALAETLVVDLIDGSAPGLQENPSQWLGRLSGERAFATRHVVLTPGLPGALLIASRSARG